MSAVVAQVCDSTLTKLVGVRKTRDNIISHLKWLLQIGALKLEGMKRIVL